ncbi:MAG: M48 family metalloprotease, partial [Pseudomonadota bacterium]
ELPLVLAPDPDSTERVVLSDPVMIEAIGAVCPRLHGLTDIPPVPARRPSRLWRTMLILLVLVVVGAGAARLQTPQVLSGFIHADTVAELGAQQVVLVARSLGGGTAVAQCTGTDGIAALDRLISRLSPEESAAGPVPRLIVLDDPAVDALALPGGQILLTRGLLEAASAPEQVAGVLAVEAAHVAAGDPLRRSIGALDVLDRLDLLTGASLEAEAEALVTTRLLDGAGLDPGAADAALSRLEAVGLPWQPFAVFLEDLQTRGAPYAVRRKGLSPLLDTVSGGVSADAAFTPALGDRDWLALGNICEQTAPVAP